LSLLMINCQECYELPGIHSKVGEKVLFLAEQRVA
jgi:hypothetical protein